MNGSKQNAALRRAAAAVRRTFRNSRGSESGNTLVEFALSATVIFALFFGIIQFGYALYTYQFVNEMAREMTRYAIVRGSACSSSSSMPNCGFNDDGATLQAYVRSAYKYPGINSNQVTVTSAWYAPVLNSDKTVNGFTLCVSGCNAPGDVVKVTVSYPFLLSIPFWRSRTLQVSSSSVMVISQ